MNYLAHAFLSGTDEQLLVGNFIADSVRGKQVQLFPAGIAAGILLHRQIDTFTDVHPVVLESKVRLRPGFGKYAGVITDIFYDHFLAVHFSRYSPTSLSYFVQHVYATVQQYDYLLPERVQHFLPHMIQHNWLLNYAQLEGIRRSLTGLSRRSTHQNNMALATDELQTNYIAYQDEFHRFFPELQAFVQAQIK